MATAPYEPQRDDSEDLVLSEVGLPATRGDAEQTVSAFAQSLARTYADRVPPERAGALHWV